MKQKRKRVQTVWVMVAWAIALTAALAGCQATEALPGVARIGEWLRAPFVGRAGEDLPLTASGTIEAKEVRIASELGGRIVKVLAGRGATVQAGEVVVQLDATPLQTQLAEAEAAVAAAQADLAVVLAGPRAEKVAALRAAWSLSEAQRDGALVAWENTADAIQNPQDLDAQIADARAQVNLAEQSAILAEAQLAREQLVRDQKPEGSLERDIANWQVKAAEESLAAAQADREAAGVLLDWLWAIRNRPLVLIAQEHAAEGEFRMADAGVEISHARLEDALAGPTPEEIAVARAAVQLAQAQADAIRAQQAEFLLTTPVDGVVLNQILYPGELAVPAGTILTIADLRTVTLVVYVPVDQIVHVQVGQTVQVAVDSFPGQAFPGKVKRVADEPEFTPRNVVTQEDRLNTFYAVEIRLPNPDGLLKPGMPADARFDSLP